MGEAVRSTGRARRLLPLRPFSAAVCRGSPARAVRTGRYLTFSCSVLMMSVRFLPSTCSWYTHILTSSSNSSRSSTLRPMILAIAEPQLPEPTIMTFSFACATHATARGRERCARRGEVQAYSAAQVEQRRRRSRRDQGEEAQHISRVVAGGRRAELRRAGGPRRYCISPDAVLTSPPGHGARRAPGVRCRQYIPTGQDAHQLLVLHSLRVALPKRLAVPVVCPCGRQPSGFGPRQDQPAGFPNPLAK
jgi:hypothetical protein